MGVQYCLKDSPSTSDGRRSIEKARGNRSTSPVTLTDLESCGEVGLEGESKVFFFRDICEVPAAGVGEDARVLAVQGGCIRVGCIH